jgi:hypothetical protein
MVRYSSSNKRSNSGFTQLHGSEAVRSHNLIQPERTTAVSSFKALVCDHCGPSIFRESNAEGRIQQTFHSVV